MKCVRNTELFTSDHESDQIKMLPKRQFTKQSPTLLYYPAFRSGNRRSVGDRGTDHP
jgi:hypothetical protein